MIEKLAEENDKTDEKEDVDEIWFNWKNIINFEWVLFHAIFHNPL